MPTTKFRNIAYRMLLPFCAPSCGRHPVSYVEGHEPAFLHSFSSLIRKHHVLGSTTLLESGSLCCIICTSSYDPVHNALPGTYYRVASITKTATAILMMRLSDMGIVNLDDCIGRFFSGLPAELLEGITLRHLLSHTSGLTDPSDLESFLVSGVPFTELIPDCRRFSPGSRFHYSNLGYGLLGCIMESALKATVGKIYQDYLFEPLHLNATLEGFLLPQADIMPVSRILPYRKGKDIILSQLGSVPVTVPDPLRHYGYTAGSMYTDVVSLQTLLHILIKNDPPFLSDYSRTNMKHEHASYGKISPSLSYGLGLLRIKDPSISSSLIYGHQGFAYGCADGAFVEEETGRIMITLNGGCSEARCGRLGLANRDFLRWAFQKELPAW